MFKIILFFTILGAISSAIGGLLAILIHIKTKNNLASLFEITAGMMTGIVCFDMLPESLEIASIWYSIIGVVIGIGSIFSINSILIANNNKKDKNFHTSFVALISMGLHNAIEGIAIGAGFSHSYSLGISLLLSIFLHDIPEGMVVGMLNQKDTKKISKIIFHTILVGGCVGIGCFLGLILGDINDRYIALNLSIASGAMLYIVACDLIPSSKKLTNDKKISLIYMLGVFIGALFSLI